MTAEIQALKTTRFPDVLYWVAGTHLQSTTDNHKFQSPLKTKHVVIMHWAADVVEPTLRAVTP